MRRRARTPIIGDGGKGTRQLNEMHVAQAEGESSLSTQGVSEAAASDGGAKRIEADLITKTDGGRRATLEKSLHGGDGATSIGDRLAISAPLAESAN